MNPGKGTTIKDVATLAGVSPATVSLVINGSDRISAATVARVNRAVEKLNFRPNSIARSLRTSRTLTTGMINTTESSDANPFIMPLMAGVEETAREHGFSVFLCNSYGSETLEKDYLEMLLDQQVSGIIFVNSRPQPRGAPALELGALPHVFLYQYAPGVKAPSVTPDDATGAHTATRYLLDLGHRRIGYINGDRSYRASSNRYDGYRNALEEFGLAVESVLVQQPDTWYEEGGYEGAKALLRLPDPPSALFCASDELAVGAMEAIKELGLHIPDDVSLVGFDDRPEAGHKRPPLTTVALPFHDMGKLALDLLLAMSRGEEVEAGVHYVPCPLVERSSCRQPTARAHDSTKATRGR